jgi:CTP:molybdopterin cytidylyltransferase MocA
MGRPKLALHIDGRPVIELVLTALRDGGANPIVVVVGPHDPSLAPLARAAGAEVCEVAAATPDMRMTVEQGLRWLEARHHPRPDDAWLLAPADYPLLDAVAVRQLCAAFQQYPAASILIPTHAGRHGHPALIAWHHVTNIRTLPAGVGIDAYLRERLAETHDVVVTDAGVLDDMDTPSDYERMR